MIKRVLSILFLLLANSILLGHSIIIHHHHPLAIEGVLHAEHESEHFHQGNQDNSLKNELGIPEHCHLFSSNELYLTFISQSDQSIKKQQLTNYFLIGSEQVELDKISETNYISCDLTLFTKPLCKQGTIIPRGPPIA